MSEPQANVSPDKMTAPAAPQAPKVKLVRAVALRAFQHVRDKKTLPEGVPAVVSAKRPGDHVELTPEEFATLSKDIGVGQTWFKGERTVDSNDPNAVPKHSTAKVAKA